jgi:hypothetical protein
VLAAHISIGYFTSQQTTGASVRPKPRQWGAKSMTTQISARWQSQPTIRGSPSPRRRADTGAPGAAFARPARSLPRPTRNNSAA